MTSKATKTSLRKSGISFGKLEVNLKPFFLLHLKNSLACKHAKETRMGDVSGAVVSLKPQERATQLGNYCCDKT